ncbi:response regulator [Paludibacterium purpuratum]|uniref:Response regulator receiver domain-containing protein n=1 Tax=Paludibacterium purpuratum TaxID=1144873 RepID=A0A4V3DW26_9NEIS|nr:response regulator [Paludibacterium purpuratum]TDR82999.1 response regulator receiver domain-containing protein [Paludibacterium purpuratum]
MDNNKILVMDDEPHILDWLSDYLAEKGYECTFAKNVAEAVEQLKTSTFRMLILDLNVPAPGEYGTAIKAKGDLFTVYRGLYVAEMARGMGYRGRQVIVYSVHDVDEVRTQTDRMSVSYVTKGRPRSFKKEIDDVLSFDPTSNR